VPLCASLHRSQVKRFAFDQLKAIFSKVDILVTPTTAITAPEYGAHAFPHGESNVEQTTQVMR
jgi:Asp-tRNA(Asn)/Glu-tRNA(Gln) amidotransferase A subunit family amidase